MEMTDGPTVPVMNESDSQQLCMLEVNSDKSVFKMWYIGNQLILVLAVFGLASSVQRSGPPLGAELAVIECKAKYRVPREDVDRMKEKQLPETKNGKCMLACILKKMNVLTKKGEFDLKQVQKLLRNQYKNDPQTLRRANFVAESCAKSLPSLEVKGECDVAVDVLTCVRRESKLAKRMNDSMINNPELKRTSSSRA